MLNNHQFNDFQYNLDGVSEPFPFPVVRSAWAVEDVSDNVQWTVEPEVSTP